MNSVDVTQLETQSSQILDQAQREAIALIRNGKPEAVMISPELYEHYEKLEDAYWAGKIEQRQAEGTYLSHEESLAALKLSPNCE